MARSLILDTNVFYNLGSGRLTVKAFIQPGDILCYSPVSVIELAGKWSDRTHHERKGAARTILTCCAVELLDPEAHLTTTFGYTLAQPRPPMHQAVAAMAGSSSLSELQMGVRDFKARVIRRVSVTAAHGWRVSTEGRWVGDMLRLMETEIPVFATWYSPVASKRRGPVPKLTGRKKYEFLAGTTSREWFGALIVACQRRALLGTKREPDLVPIASQIPTFLRAIDAVSAYCAIYTQYVVRLLTDGALPEANDSGDLELFLYSVDNDYIVVTSEQKWARLAKLAGYPQRVLLV